MFGAVTLTLLASGELTAADGDLPGDPSYVFQRLGDDLGLTTRTVVSLVQDSRGFIWIGTLDGLFRYDGAQVESYGKGEGLQSPYINQIVEAPDGTIYVLTYDGVARTNGQEFEPIETGNLGDMGARLPQRIAVDAQSNLFVACTEGLQRIPASDRDRAQVWTTSEGLPQTAVDAVHVAVDGKVWIASGNRVGFLDPESDRVEMISSSAWPCDDFINSILSDTEGRVWVRTANHLARLEPGAQSFVHDDEGLPPASLYGMPALDRDGSVLVPTHAGLFYREADAWRRVGTKQGLTSNNVFAVLEDHEGALWIGFGGAGIARWPGRGQWSAWTSDQGLPDDTVWQSLRDPKGRLWVGTSNGVAIWDPEPGAWRVLTEDDGIAGPGIWQLAVGQDDHVWSISDRSELTRYNPETLAPEKFPIPGMGGGRVARMASGPGRTLWVSSNDKLLTIKMGETGPVVELFPVPAEVAGCAKDIAFAPDGVMWTSGAAGLARYDGESWSRFSTRDGLRVDAVGFMVATSGQEVWFVYQDLVGVAHLVIEGGRPRIMHFGIEQGLPSNSVYSLGLDSQGTLWAGGDSGLVKMTSDGPLRTFTMADGLVWEDLSSHSFLAEPDGSFFIGTSRGLAHYHPAGKAIAEKQPSVVITSATLGGEESLGLAEPMASYENRVFNVRYSGLTFREPSSVRFHYRLLELEEEYQETSHREVRYATLPAGAYVFEVLCRSASGLWSQKPATFAFVVQPPWWGTWWARSAAVALLLLLIAAVVWWRTRKLQADRRRLETAVAERSAELAQANKELELMSYTDALTNTHNRRYFMSVIDEDIKRVNRKYDRRTTTEPGRNIGLVFYLVDVDHFKRVNDEHGHRVGDEVLAEIALRIKSVLRQSDLLVRWGGEEFLIVCGDSEPAEGSRVSRRILDAVGADPFDLGDGNTLRRTCSVGWAAYPWFSENPDSISFETVIELADKALYVAKNTGRNKACGFLSLHAKMSADNLPSAWLDQPFEDIVGSLVQLETISGPAQVESHVTPISP
ncbi:MAG: diguanylate cyclase [Deltaproteobacteria bacterium]|nr:diguanylate cyclase [Deltaproteobacteria bacterium]